MLICQQNEWKIDTKKEGMESAQYKLKKKLRSATEVYGVLLIRCLEHQSVEVKATMDEKKYLKRIVAARL